MPNLDRRQFLAGAGAVAASGLVLSPVPAQTVAPAGYGGQYRDMLYTHIAGKLNAFAKSWDAERRFSSSTKGSIQPAHLRTAG